MEEMDLHLQLTERRAIREIIHDLRDRDEFTSLHTTTEQHVNQQDLHAR